MIKETMDPVVGLDFVKVNTLSDIILVSTFHAQEFLPVSDPTIEPFYQCSLCDSQVWNPEKNFVKKLFFREFPLWCSTTWWVGGTGNFQFQFYWAQYTNNVQWRKRSSPQKHWRYKCHRIQNTIFRYINIVLMKIIQNQLCHSRNHLHVRMQQVHEVWSRQDKGW